MRWFRRLSSAAVVIGLAIRIKFYLDSRPLGHDESVLSINILTRSFGALLTPLEGNQFSPLGFLWAERLVTYVAGSGEIALRFVPLIAGLLGLVAFSRLAGRLLDPPAALAATVLAVLSPFYVHYAAEVKSYGLDALMVIVLMHATLDLAGDVSARHLRRWALVGAITAFFSTAAPFIVGGCALALLFVETVRRDRTVLLRVAAASTPAALIFLIQYFTIYHAPAILTFMEGYWASEFLQARPAAFVAGLAHAVRDVSAAMLFGAGEANLPPKSMTVAVVLAAIGGVVLTRRRAFVGSLLLAPLALAVVASLAHRWPMTARLMLFVAPSIWITLAAGVAAVVSLAPMRARATAFATVAMLLTVAAATGTVLQLRSPVGYEETPQAMSDILAGAGDNATVYVSAEYRPACFYYAALHPARARFVVDTTRRDCSIGGPRMVMGSDRVRDPGGKRLAVFNEPAVSVAWIEGEVARIVSGATAELWIMDQRALDGTDVLRPALERAGAVRVATLQRGRLTIDKYQLGR